MSDHGATAKVASIPPCDIHKSRGETVDAVYDGATVAGPWAYMCDDCMGRYGIGIGTGRGQRLVLA